MLSNDNNYGNIVGVEGSFKPIPTQNTWDNTLISRFSEGISLLVHAAVH